jgi:hypothetical protein
LKSITIILSLAFFTNCKANSNQNCASGSSVKASLAQLAQEQDTVVEEVERLGGYLDVRFSDALLEGNKKLLEFVKGQPSSTTFTQDELIHAQLQNGIYRNHSCTALYDFEFPTTEKIEVHTWTSRHCIPFPFIETFDARISTAAGYIKVPLSSDYNLPNTTIEPLMKVDFDAFLPFFMFVKSNELRSLPRRSFNESKRVKSTALLGNLDTVQGIQQTVFQRSICNSFTRNGIQLKNFDVEKLCFNLKDLMVISGTIDVSALSASDKTILVAAIKKSITDRDAFLKKTSNLVKRFSVWRNAIELMSLSNYLEKLTYGMNYIGRRCYMGGFIDPGFICNESAAVETFKKEAHRVLELVREKATKVKLPEYLGIDDSNYDYLHENNLMSFNDVVKNYIQPLWLDLITSIADTESLYIHTNVIDEKNKTAAYQALRYVEIVKGTNYPPIIQPLGFAHLLPKDFVKFSFSDSGSIVTVGGYYPLITLSTVNDDESSGGYSDKVTDGYEPGNKSENQQGPDLNPSQAANTQPESNAKEPSPSNTPKGTNPDESPGNSIYDDEDLPTAEHTVANVTGGSQGGRCAN